jgi:uncharacterized protein YxeA
MKYVLGLICIIIVVILAVFGVIYFSYSHSPNNYYLYQGTQVVTLNQYQQFVKKLPSKQDFSATAYDSTADKILVTYDFIGHKSDYILYGIPQGIRETFGQVLNSINKNN